MLPSWEALRETWPMMAAVAVLWARLELTMYRQREASDRGQEISRRNEAELRKLEARVESHAAAAQEHAVQLSRIEEAIKGLGKAFDRLADQIAGQKRQ